MGVEREGGSGGLLTFRIVIDPILLEGIRRANQCEREAVDKVLGKFSELRIPAIWARLRRLRQKQKSRRPLPWTKELDDRLKRVHREDGLSASVTDIRNLTDWPRRAILRRAHKLGLPTEPVAHRRRWTMAEYRFALESVNHLSCTGHCRRTRAHRKGCLGHGRQPWNPRRVSGRVQCSRPFRQAPHPPAKH